MKILRVTFKKLFAYYDYTIDFNNSVTIIHGLNGCGKTTMLKLIDAVFNNKMDIIKKTQFKSVEFLLSDKSTLTIERKKANIQSEKFSQEATDRLYYLVYALSRQGRVYKYETSETSEDYIVALERLSRVYRPTPFLRKISDNMWHDAKTDEDINFEELVTSYGDYILRRSEKEFPNENLPDDIQSIIESIDVRLIASDRLIEMRASDLPYAGPELQLKKKVDIIASSLSHKIREAIQQYAQISQAKDRTFPIRAIKHHSTLTVDEIKCKISELEKKRQELIDTGILEKENDDINIKDLVDSVTEDNRQNLSLYVEDNEEKLSVLSGLSSSINLFRQLIEGSFTNKKMVFNKNDGFYFHTTYSDQPIKPQFLSSGEQHELVILYDLIFNTNGRTLILIDEPELSLHIKWQLDFVDQLLDIINKNSFSVVLATHSPQIINGKWDLTVCLSQ